MLPYSTRAPRPNRRQKLLKPRFPIETLLSENFDQRKRPIRFCVLHYTGMDNPEDALNTLRFPMPRYAPQTAINPQPNTPQSMPDVDSGHSLNSQQTPPTSTERQIIGYRKVSSHYLVYPDGRIFLLVPENKRAWHAGAGSYGGETDMNSASIGIEIQNGGHDFGLPDFPAIQIEAVMELVEGIKQRHGLDKQHIIGHADWAPGRKLDPGEKFPWHKLEERGISLHIPKGEGDGDKTILADVIGTQNDFVSRAQSGLKKIGYGFEKTDIFDSKTKDVLIAFQRRFRQSDVSGILDVEILSKIERLARIVTPT